MTSPSISMREAQPKPVIDWLFWLAIAAVVATYIRAIWFTPIEAVQGPSQKIFYVHVPAVLGGYLAFATLGIMSIVHLWLKEERADRLAAAAGEVAVLFFAVVLITGSIYAKVIWGAWWVWELRLTLTLLLWFLGVGYLVMRGAIEDPLMRARFCAVLAVMQVVLIPFVHLSVYLVRDHMHPDPVVLKPDRPSLPGSMLVTFVISTVSFLLLSAALMRARYRYTVLRDAADAAEQGGAA
jgi:heme exporter protein C